MENKNWHSENSCRIRGRILKKEPIDASKTFLLVETTLPGGKKTEVPCSVSRQYMPGGKNALRIGAWAELTGVLDGIAVEEPEFAMWWVEVTEVRVLPADGKKTYQNHAFLRGVMEESGCLLDKGVPVSADFFLEMRGTNKNLFEMEAVVPRRAVHQFLGALGSREVAVEGALEFFLAEKSGKDCVGTLLHVRSIAGVKGETKKNDS